MSALISDCGQYRYVLRRSLGSIVRWYKPMLFIMLNPSTADAETDDPTIRRCMNFAKREGATHLTVVNLFALRATDPKQLENHPDPIGPDNDKHIEVEILSHFPSMPIVAAWGSNAFAKERAKQICEKFPGLFCLGKTKNGSPRHPLYLNKYVDIVSL